MRFHNENRKFQCKICPFRFLRLSDLTMHSLSHTTENDRKCELCSKEFENDDTFNRHVCLYPRQIGFETTNFLSYSEVAEEVDNLDSENVKEHLYECDLCTYTCASALLLRRHKQLHPPDD
ncbi:hypothetical protein NPIL_315671 [Nephila pilipes]|uniref:C2H2-type domain-containing protein n=1 Tax=Nephila pilipes TaxID=299642 RepID=A0A8X6N295_NEPPI|nr:hypothetical protein NPIL_315671 [Nephila pilipes]